MAKGVFYLIDVEHEGDVQYAKSFILNADDDVEFKFFTNLSDAKHWIDKYNVPNNG